MATIKLEAGTVSVNAAEVEVFQQLNAEPIVSVSFNEHQQERKAAIIDQLALGDTCHVSIAWGKQDDFSFGSLLKPVTGGAPNEIRLSWLGCKTLLKGVVRLEHGWNLGQFIEASENAPLKSFLTCDSRASIWHENGAGNCSPTVAQSVILPNCVSSEDVLLHTLAHMEESIALRFSCETASWQVFEPTTLSDFSLATFRTDRVGGVDHTCVGRWMSRRERNLKAINSDNVQREILIPFGCIDAEGTELLVAGRRDRFRLDTSGTSGKWETDINIVNFKEYFDGLKALHRRTSWSDSTAFATGLVTNADCENGSLPLLTVELDGNAGVVTALLLTASADVDHKQGLHASPFPGARVLVGIPQGFCGEPDVESSATGLIRPICFGEIRGTELRIPELSQGGAFLSFEGGVLALSRGQSGGYVVSNSSGTALYSHKGGTCGLHLNGGEIKYSDESDTVPADNQPDNQD